MLPVISLSLIVTVSGQSESWSWAEDRTEDRIVGRFVSEEQSLQVVDPVLGSLSTQLADPSQFSDPELASLSAQFSNSVPGVEAGQLSEPEADGDSNGVLQGQFTQEETEPLTLMEGDTPDFEEHLYDYQDQLALPQEQQVFVPPPSLLPPQLQPAQHHQHHGGHPQHQRHQPKHQGGECENRSQAASQTQRNFSFHKLSE